MDTIFIDADAFVALLRKSDSNHKKALKLQKFIELQEAEVFTSSFALGEAITVISQEEGLIKAVEFGKRMFTGGVNILNATIVHQEKALRILAKQVSKNSRFTDMINIVLMDELKIDTIFSFDQHYPKNGYKLLNFKA